MTSGLAVGRKEIMKALDVGSWRTIQRWKTKYPGFQKIIRRSKNNKPVIVIQEAIDWLVGYDESRRRESAPK